ncbi:TrbC/VirB2 family protein [Christensenellaceae bacterium OttesenSCG-928-M15]|nr:TrbC/VirB2 family protein [Christensenellaceae bacterium OttesenSCG-928-M15]
MKMNKRQRRLFSILCVFILLICCTTTALADDSPLDAMNNLSTFLFGLIKSIGLIILAFGIVQVGLSLKSHDPSQRANGMLTVAGGVVIAFAKEILDLIVGG